MIYIYINEMYIHMCVWNIWIDVKLLLDLQQGGSARLTDTAQRRHCQFVVIQSLISSAYLHRVIISLNGNRPSQEPARRIFHKFHFLKRNSMCCYFIECTVAAICHTLTMETFRYLLGSFHQPIPVRYNWSVFASKMHSTSEFEKIVLSKCVIHAGMNPSGKESKSPTWSLNLHFST